MAGGAVDVAGGWPGLEKQPAGTKAAIVAQLQRLRDAVGRAPSDSLLGGPGLWRLLASRGPWTSKQSNAAPCVLLDQ